jgi:hypothetical protein
VPRPRAWAARACSTSSSRDDLLTSGFGHAGEPTHDLNTSLMERESLSRPLRQRRWPLCRGFVDLRDRVSPASCVGRRRETSRCVARTADVSGMCPRVLDSGNTKVPFAGTSCKPSDGLEPSTPSLPCDPNRNRWQPVATVSRYLKPFRRFRRAKPLPPVAPPLFHSCSIPIGPKRAV